MVQLNDLLFDELVDDVVKDVNVKNGLELSIFAVHRSAAPKNGLEFCQGSNSVIRSSLAYIVSHGFQIDFPGWVAVDGWIS